MLYFVLFAFFVTLVKADGYWDIQLSPNSITSVPFGSGHISVWEHATDRGRYYAMPLVYLQQHSARTLENIITGEHELSFDVLMWSVEAKESVYRHLKQNINSSAKLDQIEMLPMEKIRIVWPERARPMARYFKLLDHWKSNTHLPATVTFQFTCSDAAKCLQLKEAMKNTPTMFSALELEYIINGQRASRRSMTITGSMISKGNLFTSLQNMPNASSNGDRYLTSNDLKTITSESVSTVIGSVVTDSSYVDTGDEVTMKDILMHLLERNEVNSDAFEPRKWDSVFWNPTWARPDKMNNYLNKVLSKDTTDTRVFRLDESQRSRKLEGGGGGSFMGIIKVSGNAGSTSSSQSKVQKEDVSNFLKERHNHIEFSGEQFRVKPMKLYRINLSSLNTSSTIATANIQIRRYESVHSIKLRLADESANQTPSLTPQLVETRLNEKISQSNAALRATESRLREEREARVLRLENAWKARLAPVDTKLATIPGWINNQFCILANGNCPPGFVRITGFLHAIGQYAANGNYIKAATFGSSKISCHGPCGRYPNWFGEIDIVSCCK